MKITHFFLILILLFACTYQDNKPIINGKKDSKNITKTQECKLNKRISSNNELIKPSEQFDIYKSNREEFQNAKKRYNSNFITDTNFILKINNQFKLKYKNGKSEIFKDVLNIGDSMAALETHYFYLGRFPTIDHYLVFGKFYEFAEYYFINKSTGKKQTISGKPKLSTNNKFLANKNEIGGYGDELFGFQIHTIFKDKITTFEIYNDFIWYPIDFVWDIDNTLIVQLLNCKNPDFQNGIYDKSKDCEFLRLKFK